jgi:hypothetical protein
VRISKSGAVATVVAAGMLVLGTDFATYGVTGRSLVLGHFNSADTTTTLTSSAAGPALRLRTSRPGSPALAVNSTTKVRHLNADTVDGMSAPALASHAITYSAGKRGDRIAGARIWSTPVAPGIYQVSFKAIVIPRRGDVQDPVQVVCGVADLLTVGASTHVYTADSATYIGTFPAIMSGAEVVRIRAAQQPGLLCTTAANTGGVNFRLFKAVTASFTRLNSREVRSAEALVVPAGRRTVRLGPAS